MAKEGAKKKIVLADDEKFIGRAYSEGLMRAGFEVTTVVDGADALAKIKALVPDMVLLDLIMPGMTGFEVLKAMKSEASLKNVPVIILSNLSQETDKKEAMGLGASDFIVKSDASLLEVVEKVKSYFK
ncbi:MAG TPA: response regulator [Candidatus Limnocylindria bacterium]|nr:response regulator [Candidatus Limnocylindria bacterium]